jgi:hypothetical protein
MVVVVTVSHNLLRVPLFISLPFPINNNHLTSPSPSPSPSILPILESSDPHKLNCNMVIQFMCDTDNAQVTDKAMQVEVRNGGTTNAPREPGLGNIVSTENSNRGSAPPRGRHESEAFYAECKTRYRNQGLFTADQKLRGNTAKYTRQNPHGTRRGLECPEERDYYPYWSPSPWLDVAFFDDQQSSQYCQNTVVPNSQNTATTYKCVDPSGSYTAARIRQTSQSACEAEGGVWTGFNNQYGKVVACEKAEWTRVNHLGNARNGQPWMYNWTLPLLSELPTYVRRYSVTVNGATAQYAKCALRLRYNISTDDYDPIRTNSSFNQNKKAGVRSPVEQNPTVNVNALNQGLRLAINTAQFGRTFQDRSHVFFIRARPGGAVPANAIIQNLNVRGKRGNIVQTFPAVEYDFQPNQLSIPVNSLIHLQWTGSNTHNNGNPAGDGQAGDAGEGRGGTDRNNFVLMPSEDKAGNYPIPIDKTDDMFDHLTCYTLAGTVIPKDDCALLLASSGYYRSEADVPTKAQLNVLLNNAGASLVEGVLVRPTKAGLYHYMCTRNNNFSNRSQKGAIVVTA